MSDSATTSFLNACQGPLGGAEILQGKTHHDRKEVHEWIARFEKDITPLAKALNDHLETRTYIVGHTITNADLWTFVKLHEQVGTMTRDGQLKRANLTRWFDLIQEQAGSLGHLNLIAIDLDLPEFKPASKEKVAAPAPGADDKKTKKANKKDAKAEEKKAKKEAAAATAATPAEATPAAPAAAAAVPAASAAEGAKPAFNTQKKEKKVKAPKAPAAPVGPATPQPWQIDLRVGRILKVEKHPDADSLYVETVDIGEPEPRTVVSGLVKHIPIEEMENRWLVCVCNLKPATMRGVKSFAMVLAATDDSGKLELVDPPKGSKPGDKCYFGDWKEEKPEEVMNPKKKIWETIQPGLHTTAECRAAWKSDEGVVHVLKSEHGDCTVPSVVGAKIK
ncbi:G4 quadruplex nucleic acid binding protein [Mortierella sp. GBA35]|nr:G4 quadruplex nucleic acid binding protein [Mortierella sp. AD031]KAF9092429.1 G4 quadruplex nucleic acid binding protein [Mortierella sp. GBA35]KAG0219860.1 G4 quadruplex nucleic acid binding protein [Mortierella sp. NVP41]